MDLVTFILGSGFLASVGFYFYVVNGRVLYPTLPNLAFLFHFLYPLGMATVILKYDIWDAEWVAMNLLGPIFMVAGAFFANLLFRFAPSPEWKQFRQRPLAMDLSRFNYVGILGSIAIVSLIVAMAYAVVRGEHMVFTAMQAAMSGEDLANVGKDLTQKRLSLSAGTEGYWAPGYLKQFQDVLLPIVTMFVYCRWKMTRHGVHRIVFGGLFCTTVYFMMSSGQRSPVVLFLFACALLARNISPTNSSVRFGRIPKWVIVLMLGLFVILTLLLGREQAGDNLITTMGRGIYNLYARIVVIYPDHNIRSKPVWQNVGPLYGWGWYDGALQVLPGTQRILSNELHHFNGGSKYGHSSVNLWGEAWMNFRMWGIPFIGIIFGFVCQRMHIRYVRKRVRGVRALVYYCFLSTIMPLVNQPITFIIKGGLTLGILWLIFQIGDTLKFRPSTVRRGLALSEPNPRTG